MSQVDFLDVPKTSAFPAPRAFQDIAHRELRAGFIAGHQRQVLMAPTGAGKTYLGLRICNESIARGKRALFICDRKTLINQTSETATRYGMPLHGIIQAQNPRFAMHRSFQIASAQTLAMRGVVDDFDVIVVDECHTLMTVTTELVQSTKAAVIGLSATPFTKGLGAIYSRVVNAATMHELVSHGVLTPFDAFSCVRPDMKGAKTSGGEWTAKDAGERGMTIVGDVVKEWFQRADGLKTIVFGSSITHCEELRKQFEGAGVRAELFTSNTKDDEREDILREYRKPDSRIRVLISVEALAKGFDVPDVMCVCDARPLRKSLSTFIQMLGRGLRSHPGKDRCVFLDFSGNIIRFADDFSDIYFNGLAELDKGERLDREVRKDDDEREPKPCPSCGASPMGKRCIKCGFEPVRKSLVEHEHGTSKALDILGTSAGAYAKNEYELYCAIATVEKNRARMRVAAGRKEGKVSQAVACKFKDITGRWPPRHYDFEMMPDMRPSTALRNKLKSLDIAWIRSRGSPRE